MKLPFRRMPRLIKRVNLPAVGLGILTLAGGNASARASLIPNENETANTATVRATTAVPEPLPQAAQTQPLAAQAQPLAVQAPAPVDGPTIGEIVVVGNKVLNSAAIISLSGHKVGDPCNAEVLTDMRDRLTRTGNFGMHHPDQQEQWVKVQAEDAGNNKCKVTITVDENDKITNVTITGSGPINDEKVKALITPTPVYNVDEISKDVQKIIDLYNKQGYSIEFGSDLGPDPNNPGVLVIPIIVTRVDEIVLAKKHKTRDYVILRELKTKKGDYFNRKTFYERDRQRLIKMEFFDDVSFSEAPAGVGKVKLTISVLERHTGTISAGIGYSNRQQLVGRAEISDPNFQGRGEGVSLLWETGGAANRNSIELGYTRPWLDKHQTTLQVNLFDKTVYRFSNSLQNSFQTSTGTLGTDTRYNEQRTGATLTLGRPLTDQILASVTLRGENVRTDPLALSGINTEIIQNGPIYSVGGALVRETRTLALDPISGGYQNLSLQVGHANLHHIFNANGFPVTQSVTGSLNFSKSSLDLRQYFSQNHLVPGKPVKLTKPVFALRFLTGASIGTLPFFEQFFVGGAETLRGYREDRFWGKYMFLGSAEFRQPLTSFLKGVLFADVGDAWGGSYSNVNIEGFTQGGFKPHFGVGLGIRVGTPLGPIRLDYGIGDEGARTHFSIGNVF